MSKQDSVKVTVVIPTFNAGSYIVQAIESVLHQTQQNFEIIVCDDQSADNTVAIVQAMASNDCRIKLLINNLNKGPSYCRNRAISEANGEWIAILDADDFYHQDRLHQLIAIGELNNADFVADNIFYVDINGKNPNVAISVTTPNDDLKILTITTFIENNYPTKIGFKYGYLKPIIRRSFLRGKKILYNEDVRLGEDFVLYVECLIKGAVFLLTSQSYYYYRVIEKSLSRTGNDSSYKELSDNNLKLIDIARISGDKTAVKALEKRQTNYDKLIIYIDTIRLIKHGCFYVATKNLLANPSAWTTCFTLSCRYIKKVLVK
ncbi:MAG: glycosyltransferase family 2 protein [Methylococcaceae bacterium]|nr:glycosyltransferase family 2 protein [Methylococcaceae bacterium]MDP3902522.1 glycosyltransferase family 2 protein [Methylococcaceae bacterium]